MFELFALGLTFAFMLAMSVLIWWFVTFVAR